MCWRIGALSERPSSYPQALRAAAITKTCSDGTREMVGPAGSTSEGAFSCGPFNGADEEDELWRVAELPPGTCAEAGPLATAISRERTAPASHETERNMENCMKITLQASLLKLIDFAQHK